MGKIYLPLTRFKIFWERLSFHLVYWNSRTAVPTSRICIHSHWNRIRRI